MNNWQPYPQNSPQPTPEDQLKDYVVLIPNPNRINKSGFSDHAPRYQVCLAFWLGDSFVDEQMRPLNVHYYVTLPSHS
ncbi:MAG: hypothetical protein IJ545_04835 [Alphaproteobacteria bacterium]|nr:hypothetical protein [Alphaproteobacteria bacterium]